MSAIEVPSKALVSLPKENLGVYVLTSFAVVIDNPDDMPCRVMTSYEREVVNVASGGRG